MNKVYLIGNTTKDAEKNETPSGVAVCKFSIAVNREYKTESGERIADFFNITTWRKTAEVCGKFLKKGSKVAIIGSLQNRTYEDKEGVKRTVTDIIADEVEFLSSNQAEEKPTEKPQAKLEEVDAEQLDFPF